MHNSWKYIKRDNAKQRNRVTITGNTIAQAAGYSANSIGVEILGTSNNYLVSGNRINGNTVAQIVDSASGATKLVTNNL